MSAAISLGAKVLDQAQNIGQLASLRQAHVHQREQIYWTRRAYHTTSQSIRLDALDHAKEEIRSHYDTYATQIDTLLLALALIWPFALNTIQFSGPFVPGLEPEKVCPDTDCLEATYPEFIGLWVGLTAVVLILPFWGILMLIRCKLKLDYWLEFSLQSLSRERRRVVQASEPHRSAEALRQGNFWQRMHNWEEELAHDDDTEDIVYQLVNVVMALQEYLARIWKAECTWLVHSAGVLLWMSAVAALMLTSLSIWIFLVDKGGNHTKYSSYFLGLIITGGVIPGLYIIRQRRKPPVKAPGEDEVLSGPSTSGMPYGMRRISSTPSLARTYSEASCDAPLRRVASELLFRPDGARRRSASASARLEPGAAGS